MGANQKHGTLAEIWQSVKDSDPRILSGLVSEDLHGQLDLPVAIFEGEQSEFFKHHYLSNWHNRGIMTREIDVIREQEGW